MKIKLLFAITIILMLCTVFASCDEGADNTSTGTEISETSKAPAEISGDVSFIEDSMPEENMSQEESDVEMLVWYGEKEMDEWFLTYKESYESPSMAWLSGDQVHIGYYFTIGGTFINYISQENFDIALKLFSSSGINTGILCDYFDISKEEYIEFCIPHLQKVPYGQIPVVVCANIPQYRYDAWFAEEYWKHPDFLYSDYVQPQTPSHYTSNLDDEEHIRVYYYIDHKLIEHIGTAAFEQWLEQKDDADQNIIEFVKSFNITKEVFSDIYKGYKVLPYNPDYLFGTAEMQDEYFKVHPLNK